MPRIALAVCSFLSVSLLGLHAVAEEAPTICGVSLANVPWTMDSRELPDLRRPHPQNADESEYVSDLLVMPIYGSQPYAVLYYPCRTGHFYVVLREENKRDRFYGPIDGDPFQQLNLEASMRTLLRSADEDLIFRYSRSAAAKRANTGTVTTTNFDDPNDSLQRLGELIVRGDDRLRTLAFSMVNELPVPKYNSRDLLRDLEKSLDRALPEISDAATRRLGEEARANVAELTATAVKDWNAHRVLLPDEEYEAGNDGDAPGEIAWGEVDATSGLQVGFGLEKSDSDAPADLSALPWAFGEKKGLSVWVRQQGNRTTKFTSTDGASEGLHVWFADKEGQEYTREPLGFATGAIIEKRYRLSQGQWIRLKWCRMSPQESEPGAAKRPYWGLSVAPGEYALHVELTIAAFESHNPSGEVTVPAQGEWTGMLTVTGGKLCVGAKGD